MWRHRAAGLAALALAAPAYAQPVLIGTSVVNAASYLPPGLPNSGVAQGGMFIVKGQRLGACGTAVDNAFPLETSLNGTSIRVTIGTASRDAIMVYVVACRAGGLPDQLAAILPSDTPIGDGTLAVTYGGQTAAAPIRVVRSAFGIFTLNQAGSGPAVVQNVISSTDQPENTRTNPARTGQSMILWGTGLGAIAAPDGALPPAGELNVPVEVLVGGKAANVLYRGRSGCCAGIDQIIFEIPRDAPLGCSVPLAVIADRVVSNFTSVAISASGGLCSTNAGFRSGEVEAALDQGGLRIGNIELGRSLMKVAFEGQTFENKAETGAASFRRPNAFQFASATAPMDLAPGSCTVTVSPDGSLGLPQMIEGDPLDAGPAITVTGPAGTREMPRTSTGTYGAAFGAGQDFLQPGSYTAEGGVGSQVGGFRASLMVPPQLTWTNEAHVAVVNRGRSLEVAWTGGDPEGHVAIAGASGIAGTRSSVVFFCLSTTVAGRFVIPPSVLSALPATGAGADSMGFLALGATTRANRFTAAGLDVGFFSASSFSGKNVTYQ